MEPAKGGALNEEGGVWKRVGEYDLYHCIGQGSFASVFRGTHRPSRRVVAVKAIVRAKLNHKLRARASVRASGLMITPFARRAM